MAERILVTRSSLPPMEEYVEEIRSIFESHWLTNMGEKHEALERERKRQLEELARERRLQQAVLSIKERFGKNALLKGTNYREGARGRERNSEVGGHKA